MTYTDGFDRTVSDWLDEQAGHGMPTYLDETLALTIRTRQRPAWSSLERWLPMDLSARRSMFALTNSMRPIALLLLIALLIAVVVALAAGARKPLPAPFGPARNGDLVTSRDGDIYLIDKATSQSRAIAVDDGFDFSPIFSRDGTKFVFLRSDGPLAEPAILTLLVADADGSGIRALTPPIKSLDWFDWSPDGTRIVYMATGDLYVVDVAGGQPKRLPATGHAHFPTWLPPDGKEIVYRLESPSPAIYAIAPDGIGKRRLLSTTPGNNDFDYQGITASPDGAHITFSRWSEDVPDVGLAGWLPRLYALDVKTGGEMLFPTANGTGSRGPAVYSPDGKLIAYARIYREGQFQLVIANADGSGDERPIGPKKPGPRDGSDVNASWAFAPDGTALTVRYGTDDAGVTHLLPIDGSPGRDLGSGGFEFVDIQRVAP
jgi:Tol biopolymer transport system component